MSAIETGYSPNSGEERFLQDGLMNKLDYLTENDRALVHDTAVYLIGKYKAANVLPRDNGDPFYYHPVATAEILANWRLPASFLQEGLLHDVTEDAGVLDDELKTKFGNGIALGVSRLGIVKKYHEAAQQRRGITNDLERDQELRAMFFESLSDHPSVVLVRAAERLHNLETIWPRYQINSKSAERTARESLDVYVPFLWELGLYDTANLYANYALGVLNPDTTRLLDENLPTFRGQQATVRKFLAEIMGLNLQDADDNTLEIAGIKATKLHVYPPSYRDLAALMSKVSDIRQINPEDVPYLADAVYQNVGEVGSYVFRLINSGLFIPVGESLERCMQDLAKGGERPYYLTFIPKVRKGVKSSPIKLTFLTKDLLIARQASILHLHQVDNVDEKLFTAAERKVKAVAHRISDAKPLGPPTPARGKVYERAVSNDMMTVNYSSNGEVHSVKVQKRSSIMDILLIALTPAELMHCRGVNLQKRGRPFNFVVGEFSHLDIDLDQSDIFLTPYWLDDLRQIDEEKRLFIKTALKQVIEGEPIALDNKAVLKYSEEYREQTIQIARNRGLKMITDKYTKITGSPLLRLDVTSGFDRELIDLYGKDREKFLIEAGIGVVPEQKIDILVRNIVDIRQNRLIPMTLYVPQGQDQPGWESVFAAGLKKFGMNIRIIDGGGSNDEGIDMFITYYFDPPDGIPTEELPSFLELLRSSILSACRQEFHLERDPLLIFVIPFGLKPKSKS